MLTFLIAATLLSWGAWGIFDKLAVARTHPLVVQLYGSLVSLAFLPVYLWVLRRAGVPLGWPAGAGAWIALASVTGVLGLVAFVYALKLGSATYVIGVTAAYPVVSLLLARLFLGEPLTVSKVAGIVLVSAGLYALHLGEQASGRPG